MKLIRQTMEPLSAADKFIFVERGWLLLLLLILATALLFRPHEDTFTALDHSGYRLMGRAFAAGRGFHETDAALSRAPRELRNSFMLLSHMDERNTRDRSFLVHNLDSCTTEPFFYPLLPLSAVAFNSVVPGDTYDYFVPMVGWLFLGTLLFAGYRLGGGLGAFLGATLFMGSPVPTWCFRGFYVESIGSTLIGWAALGWLVRREGVWRCFFYGLALGLAVSYHPFFLVVSLPLVALLLLTSSLRGRFGALVGFCVGLLPLWIMTQYVAAPYGKISFGNILFNYHASASHRIVTIWGVASALGLLSIMALPANRLRNGWNRTSRIPRVVILLFLSAVSALPLLLSVYRWQEGRHVEQGLLELWQGFRWPFGLLLLALACIAFIRGGNRARALMWVALFSSPVFFYLKGKEQMGLWSQRRILPLIILLAVALLPAGATALRRLSQAQWPARYRRPLVSLAFVLIVMAGGANAVRWPAPYQTRVEAGADDFVRDVRARIRDRLTVFDYYGNSLPFAVDNQTPVVGVGERSVSRWPEIIRWLRARAGKEPVNIVTSYSNPGLEDGFRLVPFFEKNPEFDRVNAKTVLPAVARRRKMTLIGLRAEPLGAEDPPPPLHKIFDGGPLAMRGPWGSMKTPLKTRDGQHLPAAWTRQDSGVVGPIPPPNGHVRITMRAQSGQPDKAQNMIMIPPWQAENEAPAVFEVPSADTEIVARLHRTHAGPMDGKTGVYRLRSMTPYNPAESGIKGYEADLGIRVHSIRIEVTD